MWNWDQGRLEYFQFDNLKKIARFSLGEDLRLTDRDKLVKSTGLPFLPDDERYRPWRNYSRVFRLSLICAESGTTSAATPLAKVLASDGSVTADEYFHFLCESATDPSPALSGWDSDAELRYPLLFTIRYMLAKAAIGIPLATISEIIAAYTVSGFIGTEDQTEFIELIEQEHESNAVMRADNRYRQAAESIRVIGQISYLSLRGNFIEVSLNEEDALDLFEQLQPITGEPMASGHDEVFRLTGLFQSATAELELDYASTAVSDVEDAGFSAETTFEEGAKSRKTHIVIERNGKIRDAFFAANPSTVCDFCRTDTHADYPWAKRILDVHHLLPLCSGARTSASGTSMADLVALCPTCHRGVHRYYDFWLKKAGRKDFSDASEAKNVYAEAKKIFDGS